MKDPGWDRATVALILAGLMAIGIEVGGFWWLYGAFVDPDTALLPDNPASQGAVLGIVGLMNLAAGFMFATATMLLTGRMNAAANRAGAEHALAQPGEKI